MKNRKPFVMDKEMLELTDEVREIILKEEKRYTIKEFIQDEEKHKQAILKASILGAFDQSVNHILHKIRAMGKLEEEELAIIRYEINKIFTPRLTEEDIDKIKSI